MRSVSINSAKAVRLFCRELSWGRVFVLAGTAGILIFGPLAYGAVHPWAYYPIGLAAALLSLALLIQGLLNEWTTPKVWLAWARPPLWWAASGFVGLILLQTTPLPQGLVQVLSPTAIKLRGLGNGFGLADFLPLSLNPYATWLEFLKLWPAIVLFYILIYSVNSRRQLKVLASVILGVAFFEAFYGFWHFSGCLIWGWKNSYTGSRLCGTFINSDHLAALLAMATLLGFGLFLAQYYQAPRLPANLVGPERLRRWSRAEQVEPHLKAYAWLFLVLLLAVALIFTGSRGGMLSLLAGFGVMGGLAWIRGREKGHWHLIGLFLGAAVLYSLWLGGGLHLGRFSQVKDQVRILAFKGALRIWSEFPLFGSGLGTFGEQFFRFAAPELKGVRFLETHSDWLQLLAETGLLGFALAVGTWLVLFFHLMKKWRERREPLVRGLGLGCMAALAAGAFHSLGEFPFHITGFTLTYAAIAALAYLTVHNHQSPEYFDYPLIAPSKHTWTATWVFLGLIALQTLLMARAWFWWQAERIAPTEIDSTRQVQPISPEKYRQALAYNPHNSRYYAGLAEVLLKEKGQSPKPAEVEGLLRRAVWGAPSEWTYRWQLAEFYLRHYQESPAINLPRALQEFAAAVQLFPSSGFLHFRLGMVLGWTEKYYCGLVPSELRGQAPYHLKQAVKLEPRLQKFIPS